MEAEGSASVAEEVVEDVPCDPGASQDAVNEHWNEAVAEGYKEFLLSGGKNYPVDMAKEKKRNFRKRAQDFVVHEGRLYYAKGGSLRLALTNRDEQLRVFQVSIINSSLTKYLIMKKAYLN